MNAYQAHLAALCAQIVDSLLDGLGDTAHGNDHVLSLGVTVIVEETIVAAGETVHLLHVVLHDFGNGVIIFVGSLAVLEEHVGVLRHAASHGFVGVERTGAELGKGLAVDERSEILFAESLYFLNLMRRAEAVEEIHEGHAALNSGKMSHGAEVHHLLHAALAKHCKACLARGHHVLMVAKNRERM